MLVWADSRESWPWLRERRRHGSAPALQKLLIRFRSLRQVPESGPDWRWWDERKPGRWADLVSAHHIGAGGRGSSAATGRRGRRSCPPPQIRHVRRLDAPDRRNLLFRGPFVGLPGRRWWPAERPFARMLRQAGRILRAMPGSAVFVSNKSLEYPP